MRMLFWVVILAGFFGCDDGSGAGGENPDASGGEGLDAAVGADAAVEREVGSGDRAVVDAAADGGGDAAVDRDAGPDAAADAGPDAALDAMPGCHAPDAAPDARPTPRRAIRSRRARCRSARPRSMGPHTALPDGMLLDPGGRLRWQIADPGALAEAPALHLVVAAEVWRVEDGAFTVEWNGEPVAVEVRGDADGGAVVATVPYADWSALEFGPGASPPPVGLPSAPGGWSIVLEATGGSVWVREVWLVDPLAPLPEARARPAAPEPVTVLEVVPCSAPVGGNCDDAVLITAAIADAPPGPVTVRLAAATYVLRTPLRVARDDVRIEGAGAATVLLWDPAGGGPAIRFGGAGLVNAQAAAIMGPVDGASRRYRVEVAAIGRRSGCG
jgi:hypothetical protein